MVSAQSLMQERMPLSPVPFARFSDQVQWRTKPNPPRPPPLQDFVQRDPRRVLRKRRRAGVIAVNTTAVLGRRRLPLSEAQVRRSGARGAPGPERCNSPALIAPYTLVGNSRNVLLLARPLIHPLPYTRGR